MAPKPKKLTKKQELELLEKKKLEEKQAKIRELEEKLKEEERAKKIENKIKQIQEDIKLYKEEQERLLKESKDNKQEDERKDAAIKEYIKLCNEEQDWKSYSECESGYLNIRKEKEITAFLYEFEDKMETPIYINCNFIEKNIPEELVYFIYSLKYQKNLQKLYYESKATLDFKKQAYCLEYMSKLHNLVRKKVELMTVYFLENFDKLADMHKNPSKYKLGQQSVEKTINNFTDMCIEWASNESKSFKIGFWCNNVGTSREAMVGNFKTIPCKIQYLPNQCLSNPSIIRFVHTEINERDFTENEYFPYISINGMFKLDFISYPPKVTSHKLWEMKELISDESSYIQALSKETFGQQIRMTVTLNIDKKIYLKDFENDGKNFIFGRYNEDSKTWLVDPDHTVLLDKEQRTATFKDYSEINTFTLLINKKYLFPYKSWYLRTVIRQREVVDINTNKSELKTLYIAKLDIESKQF